MPFTPKDWADSPSTSTPISSAALEDMETRLSDYTDDELASVVPAAVSTHNALRSGVHGREMLYKSSDQTLTQSSTTLQNLTSLALTVAASEAWDVMLRLILQSDSGTPNFKIGWSGPSGCTLRWGDIDRWTPRSPGSTPPSLLSIGSTDSIDGVASNVHGAVFFGTYIGGGSGGTLQAKASQDSSDASNSKVLAGSLMVARRVA